MINPYPFLSHTSEFNSFMSRSFHYPLSGRIAAGIGTGTDGLTTSIPNYQALSKDLSDSLQEISQSLIIIQNQLDSLAAPVLQNRRGLDLLTVEKGGLCLFLDETCCFYANQSGVVQEAAKPYRSSLLNQP